MIPKALEAISTDDIETLVANRVREGRTLDYKLTLPGNERRDKIGFLADVCAFANTAGGDLVFGVEEERDQRNDPTGVPARVVGLLGVNLDQEYLRLENMLRTGLDPRLSGHRFQAVTGFSEGPVLVLRLPRSFAAPHVVDAQDHFRFYGRSTSGNFAMDREQIREAFALSQAAIERVRTFRTTRVRQVQTGKTPVALLSTGKFVVHIVPLGGGDEVERVSMAALGRNPAPIQERLLASGTESRINLDGYLLYSHYDYLQIFRTGAVEYVDVLAYHDKPAISPSYEGIVRRELRELLGILGRLDVSPPLVVMLSLVGVGGYTVELPQYGNYPIRYRQQERQPLDRPLLQLPEAVIDTLEPDVDRVLKPMFDVVWNAAGIPESLNYGPGGVWRGESDVYD